MCVSTQINHQVCGKEVNKHLYNQLKYIYLHFTIFNNVYK